MTCGFGSMSYFTLWLLAVRQAARGALMVLRTCISRRFGSCVSFGRVSEWTVRKSHQSGGFPGKVDDMPRLDAVA
jgi:hypothetical protein